LHLENDCAHATTCAQLAPPADSVNLDGHRINRANARKPSKRRVAAAFADAMDLRSPNRYPIEHGAPLVQARTRRIRLCKTLQNLDPDFFREWTFDLAHAIPEPDDFPLLLYFH
jgi:hypothetical protein